MCVKEWCAANEVNASKYYYWLKRVREHAAQYMPKYNESTPLIPCTEALPAMQSDSMEPPSGWAMCQPVKEETVQEITIEIGPSRITATAETDMTLLMKVCRVLVGL